MGDDLLASGKLPLDALRSLLSTVPMRDPRVLIGPRIGEDAAVIDAGERCLVIATDPVTFAVDRIGRYAVHVNANDVAVMGARPAWFFAVLLLPYGAADQTLVAAIMADITAACDAVGAALCGGHTEVTEGLTRPIVVGQMVGEVPRAGLVRKSRLTVGDQILLSRGVAIEGTAILAREHDALLQRRVAPDIVARAAHLLDDPGISVVNAALAAAAIGDPVHAMHDPTEGGLAGGLVELVAASGMGLRVISERIRVLPESEAICAALSLDPLKLIASGALLIAVAPAGVDAVVHAVQSVGDPVTVIGEVRQASEGLTITIGDRIEPLLAPRQDEIARRLEPTSAPRPDALVEKVNRSNGS